MRRRIPVWSLILTILIIMLISQLFLPGIAEKNLRTILKKETDSIEKLDIDIAALPAVKILAGRIDNVIMKSDGLMIDNLYLDTFNVSYRDIVLKEGSFIGLNTHLEALISEEAINDYIKEKYTDLKDFQLRINTEQVLLQGTINFFETDFKIQLSGNFILSDQREIYFIPDDFQIENIKIPVDLLKSYVEKLDFSFDLEELDIPLDINEIKLRSGYLVILGGTLEKGGES